MGVVLHFQSTGTVPGTGAPVTMIGPSLTIGRGPANDLCLPDPGKVISKVHCTIEDHGGTIVVVDLSSNGTFLNYGKVPLGRVATPLNDGDILTLGSYEIMVEIVGRTDIAAPAPAGGADTVPDDAGFDDLIPDSGGEDDFLDDLLGGGGALRGPSGVARPEPGEDGLLPPLGEDEDGLLDPAPDTDPAGASARDDSDAERDAFRVPRPLGDPGLDLDEPAAPGGGGGIIPDDWEDDLLAPEPAPPAPSVSPFITQPGAGDEAPGQAPPVPPPDAAAPDDIDLGEPAPPPDAPPEPPPAAPIPDAPIPDATVPPPATPAAAAPEPVAPPAAAVGGQSAARAFLHALGDGTPEIADDELDATMARLGGVMATMIRGMREILMTRASIKSEFRIQQTMIGAGGNNPLKFSISPEQAVEAMVKPRTKGYLDADAAASQALDDIKAHEVAMMAAMEAALKGILKQLAPSELETRMTGSGGISSLLKGKKARYWEIYETMYARISDQAENDFHELFAAEFAKAYQAQLERLK